VLKKQGQQGSNQHLQLPIHTHTHTHTHTHPQNDPLQWGIWTPSNTWFLGPTGVDNPNSILIGSLAFAGLTTVTNRQTTLLGLHNMPLLRT